MKYYSIDIMLPEPVPLKQLDVVNGSTLYHSLKELNLKNGITSFICLTIFFLSIIRSYRASRARLNRLCDPLLLVTMVQ